MKQIELANQLGVSKAYISMVMSGKKKPSKRIVSSLSKLGVNLKMVNFEAKTPILSHARLPIPTLPRIVHLPIPTRPKRLRLFRLSYSTPNYISSHPPPFR